MSYSSSITSPKGGKSSKDGPGRAPNAPRLSKPRKERTHERSSEAERLAYTQEVGISKFPARTKGRKDLMLKIGRLKIRGDSKWPKSRADMKTELRDLSRSLGLDLRFVTRKKKTSSWCHLGRARATICEGVGGKLNPMSEVMLHALHELSHWIQYNEGMFQNYLGKPYYGHWKHPEVPDILRLALRAERHADQLAKKLAMELFGVLLTEGSCYDDAETSKAFFKGYYTDD